jgi:hypothetical protein
MQLAVLKRKINMKKEKVWRLKNYWLIKKGLI